MNAEKIRDRIAESVTLFSFEFNGKEGHVDPYGNSFLLWFEGEEKMVYSIEDVMNTPFFDGYKLLDIADKIDILEW